jgi:hypothetical protein
MGRGLDYCLIGNEKPAKPCTTMGFSVAAHQSGFNLHDDERLDEATV